MIANTSEIEGTLQADGRLILDQKPALPAGRVRVALQSINNGADSTADVLYVLGRIHADQTARGQVPRAREEIDAAIAAMRDEDEERMQALEKLHQESHRPKPVKPS